MNRPPRITEHALPGILAEIARIAGVEVAIALAREHGGRRLYLPQRLPASHPLVRLIGARAARLICTHWGGETYKIPSARTYLTWHDARVLRDQGLSYARISQRLRITEQRVYELLRGYETTHPAATALLSTSDACPACGRRKGKRSHHCDDRQGDLFG